MPAVASALLAGMCIGFLPHNFYPARIFMGDIGAMLLGLLLAYGPISSTDSLDPALLTNYRHTHALDRFPTLLPLLVPAAIFVIPYADLMFAVIRRTRAGKPLMAADRQHLHHRLLNIGHSYRQSVLLMYLWAALFSVTVVSLSMVRSPSVVFAAATVVAVLALLPATMPRLRPWRAWAGIRRRLSPPRAPPPRGPRRRRLTPPRYSAAARAGHHPVRPAVSRQAQSVTARRPIRRARHPATHPCPGYCPGRRPVPPARRPFPARSYPPDRSRSPPVPLPRPGRPPRLRMPFSRARTRSPRTRSPSAQRQARSQPGAVPRPGPVPQPAPFPGQEPFPGQVPSPATAPFPLGPVPFPARTAAPFAGHGPGRAVPSGVRRSPGAGSLSEEDPLDGRDPFPQAQRPDTRPR